MSTPSAPLNAEPADEQSRQAQHLAPKSFADAVQQEAPESRSNAKATGGDETNGGGQHNGTSNAGPHSSSNGHTAPVLRIVNTHGENDEKANGDSKGEETVKEQARPGIEREESSHEYEAAGLDDSPKKSARATRHRKASSAKGQDTKPESRAKESMQASTTRNDNTEVFEKFADKSNGETLTSVKPSTNYEKQLQQDQKEIPIAKVDAKGGQVNSNKAGDSLRTTNVRFAPSNVPIQRRMQTLMILYHTLCIPLYVSAFCFLCAIPIFWPLAIPYLLYCIFSKASTSGSLTHRSEFLRRLPIWSLFAGYFPARLHKSADLPPTRKYIFGYHPHGIISHGAFAAFGTDALGFSQLFPGITNTLLTLDSNFRIPIYREYALAMGIASVSRESCENLLTHGGPNDEGMGRGITIVVGGARESLDAKPGRMRLVLNRRYGFVKIALRTGADLVPVVAFGENDLYDQFVPRDHPQIHRFQLLLKKLLGFTIPLFHARGVFNYDVGLMPYRRPLNIVVGRPIKVVQSARPSHEELERYHGLYIAEVKRLWEAWKEDFAPHRKEELMLVE